MKSHIANAAQGKQKKKKNRKQGQVVCARYCHATLSIPTQTAQTAAKSRNCKQVQQKDSDAAH
jgi:hypothetical protein